MEESVGALWASITRQRDNKQSAVRSSKDYRTDWVARWFINEMGNDNLTRTVWEKQ